MKRNDLENWFSLLNSLDAVRHHIAEVLSDHEDCEGCDLCFHAEGMDYTVEAYFAGVCGDAPIDAYERFKEETAALDPALDDPPADAPTVMVGCGREVCANA